MTRFPDVSSERESVCETGSGHGNDDIQISVLPTCPIRDRSQCVEIYPVNCQPAVSERGNSDRETRVTASVMIPDAISLVSFSNRALPK